MKTILGDKAIKLKLGIGMIKTVFFGLWGFLDFCLYAWFLLLIQKRKNDLTN